MDYSTAPGELIKGPNLQQTFLVGGLIDMSDFRNIWDSWLTNIFGMVYNEPTSFDVCQQEHILYSIMQMPDQESSLEICMYMMCVVNMYVHYVCLYVYVCMYIIVPMCIYIYIYL